VHAVLIVEDDPGIQDVLRFLAEANDMQAYVASSFELAIQESKVNLPDLAIVDLGLPDGDGLQLISHLRSRRHIPVIVLSARSLDSQRRAAIAAGADEYMTKPFNVPELLAKMRALLVRHNPQSDPM
jgi:two-component system KDP operon response regulator KdpE